MFWADAISHFPFFKTIDEFDFRGSKWLGQGSTHLPVFRANGFLLFRGALLLALHVVYFTFDKRHRSLKS